VIADVKLLKSKTLALWRDEVSLMFESFFSEDAAPSERAQVEGVSLRSFPAILLILIV
jgi:hypothetical protein